MFLKCSKRKKDGKVHRYWSVVASNRVRGGRVVQRQVLYLGEINDVQQSAWVKTIEVVEHGRTELRPVALFPEDRHVELEKVEPIRVRLDLLELHRPRQWGACWLACEMWSLLKLDEFWGERLKPSRKGTRWLNVLKILSAYRLISPGSEWRLHRQWYRESAMADLLGENVEELCKDTLYRCLDRLVRHREDLFKHLRERWGELFDAKCDVLLYDLTSTYFESNPPKEGLRQFGYSRDKRSDCLQVVLALVVTPRGFPLAYEVMPGNTSDRSTLRAFLAKIEKLHGKLGRVWLMDRGIPTKEILQEMRDSDPPIGYVVGTPRGRLSKLEKEFLGRPWEQVRASVSVKLLEKEGEVYLLAHSHERAAKERGMRKRRLQRYWHRLHELQQMQITRDELLEKLGAAKHAAGNAQRLVEITLPKPNESVSAATFSFSLNKNKLRKMRRKEGIYLLRSNLLGETPAALWERYMLLVEVEQAFKDLKSDLQVRPVFHQGDPRIEAHIFVCFLAYCLHVTLRNRLRAHAGGLTSRAVLDKMAAIQMLDVCVPTADGRKLTMSRYTQPSRDAQLLLSTLKLNLPAQPPPKISSDGVQVMH